MKSRYIVIGLYLQRRKGISPLIAAVLLIAFTMAIAGIMATWATSFSQQRLSTSEQKADCIGGLDLRGATFSNTTLSVQVVNLKTNLNMTGLVANVLYGDPLKSDAHSNIKMKDYNVSDPLPPGYSDWFIYNTNDPVKPLKIEAYATSCGPDFTVRLVIP